jgi:hypothetical protein
VELEIQDGKEGAAMTPELGGMVEAEIVINGSKLSFGQAMTVRVALENFVMYLAGLPAKERRAGIFKNYMACVEEIREFIWANQPKR